MKLLVHDYCGHPFQVDLSRRLAERGHEVTHAWFAGDAGPKGDLARRPGDPTNLQFMSIDIARQYSKTNFAKRRFGDIEYGKAVAGRIAKTKPDLVISGNTPTESQQHILAACEQNGLAFVYWCQDFYSIAATRILEKKLPLIGHAVGAYYRRLERMQMRAADHIVLITEAFRTQTNKWGVPEDKTSVIPNWGPLGDIDAMPKANDWSREHGISDRTTVIYSGTLALKHNPDLLIEAARTTDAAIVVIASGVGVEELRKAKEKEGLDRLIILPLQPFGAFAQVLASADVLVAVIEPEAGEFSVPSKVLSYLCAGRPIVLAAPENNLAAQIVRESGAGSVVSPQDQKGFAAAIQTWLSDTEVSTAAGSAARTYAEQNFDLDRVASQFERVFERSVRSR